MDIEEKKKALNSEGWVIFLKSGYLPRVHIDIVKWVIQEKQNKIDALEMKMPFKDTYIENLEKKNEKLKAESSEVGNALVKIINRIKSAIGDETYQKYVYFDGIKKILDRLNAR